MSGELPTEKRDLETIKRLVDTTNDTLNDNELIDMAVSIDLPFLYAAIHNFYTFRGQSDVLQQAIDSTMYEAERQQKIRAELMEKFGIGSDDEAAELIASYWEGERPPGLLNYIKGSLTDPSLETYKKAIGFALTATAEDSEAQQMVRNATNLLWRDYRGGHG